MLKQKLVLPLVLAGGLLWVASYWVTGGADEATMSKPDADRTAALSKTASANTRIRHTIESTPGVESPTSRVSDSHLSGHLKRNEPELSDYQALADDDGLVVFSEGEDEQVLLDLQNKELVVKNPETGEETRTLLSEDAMLINLASKADIVTEIFDENPLTQNDEDQFSAGEQEEQKVEVLLGEDGSNELILSQGDSEEALSIEEFSERIENIEP